MADSTTHVINYVGDLTNIQNKVKELTRLNTLAAQKLGSDFTKSLDLIDQKITKISQRTIKTPMVDASGTQVRDLAGNALFTNQTEQVTKLTSVIRTADGQLNTFVETQKRVDGALKDTTLSFQGASASTKKLIDGMGGLAGKSSQIATNFSNLDRVNKSFATQLQGFGNAARFIGTTLSEVSATGSTTAKVFETASGKFVKLNETVSRTPEGLQSVKKSVTELNAAQVGNLKTIENMGVSINQSSKVSRTFADDLKTLAGRALLTIPIWLGIRAALTGMFQTFSDGAKNIISFDLALQKVKRNLSGTPEEIAKNFTTLREEITKASLETGKSTEEIAEAVKKFATIGFSFEDALKGGLEATKLSVVLFGDAGDTANAFARALKLLIDTSADAKTSQEQIAEAFALTSELEKTNQFEINEVTESLLKFSGTAKTAKLTMQETLAVLAALGTAGRAGAQGGTLLSTSFNNLVTNLDKVAEQFGVKFNPAVDDAFGTLIKVLDTAEAMSKEVGGEENVITKLADVFGGERGTKALSSLLAVNDQLKKNRAILPDVVKFNKDVADVLNTESGQAQIAGNTFKEFGKALVTGVVGGDDFITSLKDINAFLLTLQKNGVAAGEAIRDFAIAATTSFIGLAFFKIQENKKDLANEISKLNKRITDALNTNLKTDPVEIEKLLVDIQKDKVFLDDSSKEQITRALNIRLEALKLEPEIPIDPKITTKPDNKPVISEENRKGIAEDILDARLNQLRTEGLLQSELLKQEGFLKKQLNIYDSELDKAKRKLEIERAVNEEKRLQNRLGNDSLKLFEISKTEGVEVAKKIGDVLAGNTDFSTFVRQGGKELEIFKSQFEDIFNNQQAQAFFKGNNIPGLEGLRGGQNIAIQEEGIRGVANRFDAAAALENSQGINMLRTDTQTVQNMTVGAVSFPGGIFDPNASNVLNNNAIAGLPNRNLPTNTPGLGSSIDQLRALRDQGLFSKNAQISISVDFNGTENVLIGTPDSIIGQLSDMAAEKARQGMRDALTNSQSPESKLVNQRQEEF